MVKIPVCMPQLSSLLDKIFLCISDLHDCYFTIMTDTGYLQNYTVANPQVRLDMLSVGWGKKWSFTWIFSLVDGTFWTLESFGLPASGVMHKSNTQITVCARLSRVSIQTDAIHTTAYGINRVTNSKMQFTR